MLALAEFAIESILREGLTDMKSDTDMRLDDIFGRLRLPDISVKYGDNEIAKIKEVIMRTPIHIYQAQTNLSNIEMPGISIHLLADTESENKAGINDYEGEASTPINPAVIVDLFTPSSYDSATGKLTIDDSVDLSQVYPNQYFRDGIGQLFQISDLSDINGDKYLIINTDAIGIILANSKVVSGITEKIHQVDYTPADENIMIGIHTENSLLTKYLYYIVRYLLWSKRVRFQQYNLELSKYNGSDFAIAQTFLRQKKQNNLSMPNCSNCCPKVLSL